jgi:dolichol kinase
MKQLEVSEFSRKIFHLLNMVIPLIHVYFIEDRMGMLIFLSLMLIFCFFIEVLRTRYFILHKFFKKYLHFMMRDSEKEGEITGATYVFAGSLFTIMLIPKPFCIVALFFLAVGDTFAALVGMNYPFLKIGRKTLSGSFACFITCCIIGLLFSHSLNTSTIMFGAFIATLTELSSMRINDNLSIPIFSGISMYSFNILL